MHLHNAFCLTIWTGSVRHGCLATYGFHGSFEYIIPVSILNLKLFGRILYLHKNSLHKSHLLRISNTDEVFQKAKLFTINTGVQLPKLTI